MDEHLDGLEVNPKLTAKELKKIGPNLMIPHAIDPKERLVSRKDAMAYLGVTTITLHNYQKKGLLHPIRSIANNRVYYLESEILALLGSKKNMDREVILYCRSNPLGPSTKAIKEARIRLASQVDRVNEYCTSRGIRVDRVLADLGPGVGINQLPSLEKLIELVLRHKVSMVIVETSDRLARWGLNYMLERFLLYHGVELHVVSTVLNRDEYREEIKQDLAIVMQDAKEKLAEHTTLRYSANQS